MLYMPLADGFEEIEAVTPLDILRRAGIAVRTLRVGQPGTAAIGAHGMALRCDAHIADVHTDADFAGIVLPGGPGHTTLLQDENVLRLLREAAASGKLLAALCAAPSILGKNGYLKGRKACCFPGFEDTLQGAAVEYAPVVADGNFVTARGAGCALPFALALVRSLKGDDAALRVAAEIQAA
jgi:4-methyl-5(b-hydroxyethyl)-thiazole monophosphate biosynthesis